MPLCKWSSLNGLTRPNSGETGEYCDTAVSQKISKFSLEGAYISQWNRLFAIHTHNYPFVAPQKGVDTSDGYCVQKPLT